MIGEEAPFPDRKDPTDFGPMVLGNLILVIPQVAQRRGADLLPA